MRVRDVTSIGQLAYGVRGVSYRPQHLMSQADSDSVVLLRSTNIQDGRLTFDEIQIVPKAIVGSEQEVRPGDLVVCMSNGSKALVGKAARYDGDYGSRLTVGAFCSVFHPKNESDNSFIYHFFQGEVFRRHIDTILAGSAINNLRNKDIESLSICAPAVEIRSMIGDILDAIDDAIIETDALIEKNEAVRLGLLDDLIAGPAEIDDPSAPDILACLVGSISSGVSVNADDRPPAAGEYGVLKTNAVGGGRFRPLESKAVWPREINRIREPVVAGLILFSRMNTPQLVGENAYVEEDHPDLFLPDRLWAIRVKDDPEIVPEWVATILQTRQARAFITGEATGTSGSMKNIARASLLRMPLRKLPESDQRRSVEAISGVQHRIDAFGAEREKLAALRSGLRDDLLTGRVPVMAVKEATQ